MTTQWTVKCFRCQHTLRDHVFRTCEGGTKSIPCKCEGFLMPPEQVKRKSFRVMIPELAGGAKVSYYGPVNAYVVTRDQQHRPRLVALRYDNDSDPGLVSGTFEREPMKVYLRTRFVEKED